MQSPRTLGIFALSAVILAAISFAVVDVSISSANGCLGVSAPCEDLSLPLPAILFAVLGTLALLASVVPAIRWFVDTLQHTHLDADIEPMRMAIVRPAFEDDEL